MSVYDLKKIFLKVCIIITYLSIKTLFYLFTKLIFMELSLEDTADYGVTYRLLIAKEYPAKQDRQNRIYPVRVPYTHIIYNIIFFIHIHIFVINILKKSYDYNNYIKNLPCILC